MSKKYFLIVTSIVALGIFFSFNIIAHRSLKSDAYSDSIEEIDIDQFHAQLNGEETKQEALYKTLNNLLSNGHYLPKNIDDDFSKKVFDTYLERIDFSKTFFLQSDIDNFTAYKYQIDDQIKDGSDEFFQKVYTTYQERIKSAELAYQKFIKMEYDFSKAEEIELDGKKLKWAANQKELEDRWFKNMKYRILSRYNELLEDEKNKGKEKGKLVQEAVESVQKSTEYYYRRMKKFGEKEQFAFYLNSITNTYDPHTTYLAPVDKKRFDEEMSGTFFGIGAVLSMKESICEISQIVTGSPCWKQGSLKVGDGVLKVAQGKEEPVEVIGWDLEDIVNIIRGKDGTEVRLTVKHLDGSQEVIPIIRGKVETEQTFAKSIIIKDKNNKIGFISLPSFYANFNDFDGRRCSTDMKAEVEKLKAEGVNGIIIDLRNNGGGSLGDVVDIAGYFIADGPVVQVRSRGTRPQVMFDKDPTVLYNGPLAILINSNSASASEILAAALQDYKRAIILGSTSFGKGTVQRIVDLDEYFAGNTAHKPLGNLKITTQKFYRVNGGSTQLKGVVPDINIPSTFDLLDLGERKDQNTMEWDQITRADFNPYSLDFSKLIAQSKNRIKTDKQFNLIEKNASRLKQQSENNRYSLELKAYQGQLALAKANAKEMEKLQESSSKLLLTNIRETQNSIKSDTVARNKNKVWITALEKDPYISEAVKVLNDWIATLPKELSAK